MTDALPSTQNATQNATQNPVQTAKPSENTSQSQTSQAPEVLDDSKLKNLLDKYQGKPDQIGKALWSQQSENAKARKEIETLKKQLESLAPKTEATGTTSPKLTESPASEAAAPKRHPDSLLKRAMQDFQDEDKLSDGLAAEIKKANNFQTDEEYNDWVSIARQKWDNKLKEAQAVVKMPVKDLLKQATTVLSDEELVSMQISLKAGVYDVLKHVERKINAQNKDNVTVKHGSVGTSDPTASNGWGTMEEWSQAMKDPNRGLPQFDQWVSQKNKATDWQKIKGGMQMGSVRPTIKQPSYEKLK